MAALKCSMGENNGNGDHKDDRTPLERVRERLALRTAEEEGPVSEEDDPLYAWKKREGAAPPTLEQVHNGLIAVAQVSEAAIEGGIAMAGDLHKVLSTLMVTNTQVTILASKLEANSVAIDKVDEDSVRIGKVLNAVRKDVQSIKEDMVEVKAAARQMPAIKEMLGEIIARLPEPSKAKPKKRKRSV